MARQFDRQTIIDAVTNKSVHYLSGNSGGVGLLTGTYERHAIFSPKNTISRILNLQMQWDALANTTGITGTRELILDNYIDANTGLGIFKFNSGTIAQAIMFDQGCFQLPDMSTDSTLKAFPNDYAAVNANIRALEFDDTIAVSVVFYHVLYYNGANVSITENRSWQLFTEQEVVSR